MNVSKMFLPLANKVNESISTCVENACCENSTCALLTTDIAGVKDAMNEIVNITENLVSTEYEGYDNVSGPIKEKLSELTEKEKLLVPSIPAKELVDILIVINTDVTALVVIATISPYLRIFHEKDQTLDMMKTIKSGGGDLKTIQDVCAAASEVSAMLKMLDDLSEDQKCVVETARLELEKTIDKAITTLNSSLKNSSDLIPALTPVDTMLHTVTDIIALIQKEVEKGVEEYVDSQKNFIKKCAEKAQSIDHVII
ncbi:hypothetical protein EIN_424930 [Entamoeba invadens IP1]|uniref:Uncharacterized protein n=1 Tax=Entamoeba invadens IP1 TaxID=370355 RepID=A0A0A1U9B8_ENTIV|nr:hypothetical protein EIN_424930 [Entamoeba invadens IP1]ELP89771.1 hypothetical protein EIN_424930 [Entamoeba invadens IP1]|eukprot:XP_004256542.1 hypothetical protein EIN_424930 [Entamoeba invadens IP1]